MNLSRTERAHLQALGIVSRAMQSLDQTKLGDAACFFLARTLSHLAHCDVPPGTSAEKLYQLLEKQ